MLLQLSDIDPQLASHSLWKMLVFAPEDDAFYPEDGRLRPHLWSCVPPLAVVFTQEEGRHCPSVHDHQHLYALHHEDLPLHDFQADRAREARDGRQQFDAMQICN